MYHDIYMNKLARIGVLTASTAASYGISYELISNTTFSASELNPKIQACANTLGQKAVESPSLSIPCKNLPNESIEWFDYKESIVRTHDSSTNTVNEAKRIVYMLPSQTDFLEDNIVTEHDEKDRHNLAKITAGMSAGLGFVLFGGIMLASPTSRNQKVVKR